MSDIEQLPIFKYELDVVQDILDRAARLGRKSGRDILRTNRFEEPEDIAWAFLAIGEAAEKLRFATETAAFRAGADSEKVEADLKEFREQRDMAQGRAEILEALCSLEQKHVGRAKTWAALWKRAAKENRALYLMSRSTVEAWKKHVIRDGEKPDVVDETTESEATRKRSESARPLLPDMRAGVHDERQSVCPSPGSRSPHP